GPTFIKLGQIASSRRDFVPKEIAVKLEKLQDSVDSFPYEEVREIIKNELGEYPEKLFKSFNKDPLATASIGQVHVAELFSGEEIAVKIQRPEIEKNIKTDLDILHDFARIIDNKMEWARAYHIRDMVEEFSHSLLNELNYFMEGRNGDKIGQQFKFSNIIHI